MKRDIGSIAPEFNATGNDGTLVRLSSVLSEKDAVLLVFLRSFS